MMTDFSVAALARRRCLHGPHYSQDDLCAECTRTAAAIHEALEEAEKVAQMIGARKKDSAQRAISAGRDIVASHRTSDSETAEEIAAAIAALRERKG